MPSNFNFLKADWPVVFDAAAEAEKNVFPAPRTCAFYCRYALEHSAIWLYNHDSYLKKPYQNTLAAMIHEQTFKDNLSPGLFNSLVFIWKLGNAAVHSDMSINTHESLMALRHLFAFFCWLAAYYSKTPPKSPVFDESLLKKTGGVDRSSEELASLQSTLAVKDAELAKKNTMLQASEAQIYALLAQIQEIKLANKTTATEVCMSTAPSEAETRTLYIDILLREAGWDPKGKNVSEYEVTGMPNQAKTGYSDYVLWGDDGLPLAVVEAKKTTVDSKKGQHQAELYADCLQKMKGQRPVIFYTNGYETWMWDDQFYPPRRVQGFYTKDELQLLINRRASRQDINKTKVNKSIAGRAFQERAIRRATEEYSKKARGVLLVMATGTGKTRTAIALVDILMKANWVRRVLFLADRNALLKQAKNFFTAHLPHASTVDITKEKESIQSRIVFSTYPTMMNCIDETRKDGIKRFGPGYFDLIIIDEAHRSVYVKYKAIFEYFDSLIMGLTATPKSDVDKNTYQLFGLEDNMPTFAYELNTAIDDGFLVPMKAISVPLKFQREGIKYNELSEEEKTEYELTFVDEETGFIPELIEPPALNEWLFNADTVDKVLAHLMEYGLKVEGGDRIGKSIIFAKNHNHAEFIRLRFDKNYPHLIGKTLRVIDNQIPYAQSLIDDFYGKDNEPFIAVSVDMMDTGIDVPEVVNLVFFKIVRSKSKFWQMIGRGTRLCPDLFAPSQDKEFFYIFDFCENFEFFNQNPAGLTASRQIPLSTKIFRRRLVISRHLQDSKYQTDSDHKKYYEELLDIMHQNVCSMDPEVFIVRPKRKYVDEYKHRERWNNLSATDVADIIEHLSQIPVSYDDDEFARRFDLLIYNLQYSILERSPERKMLTDQIIALAASLVKKGNIPAVAAQMTLIKELQTDDFWNNVTLPVLEEVRRALRELIKFIERGDGRENVYTDFTDTVSEPKEWYGLIQADGSLANYRKKVEKYIREHEDHIAIKKIKYNKQITAQDIAELENIMFSDDSPGSKDDFEKAYGSNRPLGAFIRSIVGLDRAAAKEVFSEFLGKSTLKADQIEFIEQIINHLTSSGIMDPGLLYDPPFTDINALGVEGLFEHKDVENIINIIETVNKNAEVPSAA